jgi:hypothetical protein
MTLNAGELPDPLTPPDCDLRGLEFMALDTVRLLDSDLFAVSTGDEFKAALALWCKSWTQVPAASLPDDDRVLAHLSGAGARWKKLKPMALKSWVRCSDGRLYHPVVAEKAMEALPRRQAFAANKTAEAQRKEVERADRKRMFQDLREAGIVLPFDTKTSELRSRHERLASRSEDVTSHGQSVTSHVTGHAPVTAKRGTGTGTGTIPPTPIAVTPGPCRSDLAAVIDAAGMSAPPIDHQMLGEWLALPNMELERDVLPVVRRVAERVLAETGRAPFKLRLFDAAVRQKHAEDEAEMTRLRRGRERIERQVREQDEERRMAS